METYHNTISSSSEINFDPIHFKGKEEEKASSFQGRKICKCISPKKIFAVLSIIGIVVLILGALALAGHFGPQTGICQHLNSALIKVATKLGCDPFVLAIFTGCVGLSLTIIGGSILLPNCCSKKKSKEHTLEE